MVMLTQPSINWPQKMVSEYTIMDQKYSIKKMLWYTLDNGITNG